MIPIKLTLEGLYSYREAQTIDFVKLTNAGLFGIFGGVGSGKSSILEAISFAVYGETERLNSRENRNYNMMNLKSNRLLIDFEFRGNDGLNYRFTVNGRRNGKNYDDVKTFERNAYKKVQDTWEPISVSEAETITGLNYTNFKRTIIIPQGRFQEFLQLKETERVGMLKELFNLYKYDLSTKISNLEKKNLEALNTVSGQLIEVGEVSVEVLEAKESELTDSKKNIDEKKKVLEQKLQHEKELQNIRSLTLSIKSENENLKKLQSSETEIEHLATEVKQFETLSLAFKADFERLDKLNEYIKLKSKEIERDQIELKKINLAVEEYVAEQHRLKPEYDLNSTLLTEADELNKIADKIQANENATVLKLRIGNGVSKLKEIIGKYEGNKVEIQKLTDQIAETKQLLPDIQILNNIKAWFVEKGRMIEVLEDSKRKIQNLKQNTEKIRLSAYNQIQESKLLSEISTESGFDEIENKLNVLFQKLNEEKDKLEKENALLAVQQELEHYAHSLEEGSPCPLCGSEHHPNKLNVGEVNNQLLQIKDRITSLNLKIKHIQNFERKMIQLKAEFSASETQITTETKNQIEYESRIKNHETSFIWTDFNSKKSEELDLAFTKCNQLNELIKKSESNLQDKNKELEINLKNKETAENLMRELENQLNGINAQMSLLDSQIKSIDVQLYKDKTVDELRLLSAEKLNKQKQIVSDYEKLNTELQSALQKRSELDGKLNEAEKNLKGYVEEQTNLLENVAFKQSQTGNLSLDYIQSILQKDIQPEVEKTRISEFYSNLEKIKGHIFGLEKQLNNQLYNADDHIKLKNEIDGVQNQLNDESIKFGSLLNEISRLKNALKQSQHLKKEYDKLKLRDEDIKEMKRLFKGNGFVNFVSTAHLENLCRAANARLLTLTRQKLGIEITANNEFTIRDYMNEGKLRSVKTLSGGQTFQASLSLALALADSIHKMSGSKENFFFLDEGFGSLDKETLAVIFESLKALRKENCIVGFISHVEEMQQQIDTYIHVENTDDRGSVVHKSWEM